MRFIITIYTFGIVKHTKQYINQNNTLVNPLFVRERFLFAFKETDNNNIPQVNSIINNNTLLISTNRNINGTNQEANGTNRRANGTNHGANGANWRAKGTNQRTNGTNSKANGTNWIANAAINKRNNQINLI